MLAYFAIPCKFPDKGYAALQYIHIWYMNILPGYSVVEHYERHCCTPVLCLFCLLNDAHRGSHLGEDASGML